MEDEPIAKPADLTDRIVECARTVHSILGWGFEEIIYQRALALELEKAGLAFSRDVDQPILYDEIEVGARHADFLVEERVMVCLKAIPALDQYHLTAMINDLHAYQMETGLLFNFGEKSLKWKRFVKTHKEPPPARAVE
ncbi:MAG: GxxExxY protein [Candidatus Zixiibacteriota bacterium]|nr:MAG: GxxExxY protein [candidate division Zixibacteria bacterium]